MLNLSIYVYLHQETNHTMQARQKSRTERSMNDAHNCPVLREWKLRIIQLNLQGNMAVRLWHMFKKLV